MTATQNLKLLREILDRLWDYGRDAALTKSLRSRAHPSEALRIERAKGRRRQQARSQQSLLPCLAPEMRSKARCEKRGEDGGWPTGSLYVQYNKAPFVPSLSLHDPSRGAMRNLTAVFLHLREERMPRLDWMWFFSRSRDR